ncbi:unnamed protein product [Meganyctiphanes norvegica]|uniref:RRM domain-containing protein n=1 Tax=Meganyctiphanes norvegica TaxID=48144 RepID=A0AAV2Q4P9_MEGNR
MATGVKLFVGKLPPSCKDGDGIGKLRKLFQKYGEVSDFVFNGTHAFLTMGDDAQAADAITYLNGHKMGDALILVAKTTSSANLSKGGATAQSSSSAGKTASKQAHGNNSWKKTNENKSVASEPTVRIKQEFINNEAYTDYTAEYAGNQNSVSIKSEPGIQVKQEHIDYEESTDNTEAYAWNEQYNGNQNYNNQQENTSNQVQDYRNAGSKQYPAKQDYASKELAGYNDYTGNHEYNSYAQSSAVGPIRGKSSDNRYDPFAMLKSANTHDRSSGHSNNDSYDPLAMLKNPHDNRSDHKSSGRSSNDSYDPLAMLKSSHDNRRSDHSHNDEPRRGSIRGGPSYRDGHRSERERSDHDRGHRPLWDGHRPLKEELYDDDRQMWKRHDNAAQNGSYGYDRREYRNQYSRENSYKNADYDNSQNYARIDTQRNQSRDNHRQVQGDYYRNDQSNDPFRPPRNTQYGQGRNENPWQSRDSYNQNTSRNDHSHSLRRGEVFGERDERPLNESRLAQVNANGNIVPRYPRKTQDSKFGREDSKFGRGADKLPDMNSLKRFLSGQ